MKLIYLLLCFILIWQNNYVNGDLSNFFNGIHEAANKVRQDVRSVLHLNPKGDKETHAGTEGKIVFPEQPKSQESTVTQDNDHKAALVNSKGDGSQKIATEPPATATTVAATTTEKSQEGKAVMGSECIPGYVRTADGRCKPNFK